MKKFSRLYLLAFLALGLSSCLTDENIEDQEYGMINLEANRIIEIPSAAKAFSLLIEDKATTLDAVTVRLAANDPAAEDIKVTLSIDQSAAMVAAYNTANKANLAVYPTSRYSLPSGLVVTIPKGSREGVLKLNMNPKDLDPAQPYAIGFTITSVEQSGYVISGNFGRSLVRVSARNQYEGTYRATGYFTHPAGPASSRAIARDKTLTTINATTSRIEIGDLAGANYYMYVRVNPDNTVTILPDPTAVTQDVFPTGANTYDPATKTFTLNYAYLSSAPRRISETVVKK